MNTKKPIFTQEVFKTDQPNIDEVKCFKDGKYTHSVKIFVFPKSVIEEIENARKFISKKS